MPKIPDKYALGTDAPTRSGRSYLSESDFDTGAEIAKGVKSVGRGLGKLSAMAIESSQEDDALDLLRADAYHKVAMMNTERAFDTDPDFQSYDSKFAPTAIGITDEASALIRNPKTREKWLLRANVENEGYRNRILDRGTQLAREKKVVDVENTLTDYQKIYDSAGDDMERRTKALDDMDNAITASERTGLVDPSTGQKLREKHLGQTLEGYYRSLIDAGQSDKALDELESMGKGSFNIVPSPIQRGANIGRPRDPSTIKGMVVHETQGSDSFDGNASWSNKKNTGANYYIDKSGKIIEWAPDDVAMNHAGVGRGVKGDVRPDLQNNNTLSVEVMTRPGEKPNEAQKAALHYLARAKASQYGFTPADIEAHGRLAPGHKEQTEATDAVDFVRQNWDSEVEAGAVASSSRMQTPMGKRGLTSYAQMDNGVRNDAGEAPQGILEQGNIDVTKRPVVKNADGTISTLSSISINEDGKEVLIPTISDDGKRLSNDEAVALYKKSGKHLGKFANADDATTFAQNLSQDQGARYAEAPRYSRYLSSDRRKALIFEAKKAAIADTKNGIDGALEKIKRGQQPDTDKQGRTAFDRARRFLQPNQIAKMELDIKEAELSKEALTPLRDMTPDEAADHIAKFRPTATTSDDEYAIKDKVADEAEKEWKKIEKARKEDPVEALKDAADYKDSLKGIQRQTPDVSIGIDESGRLVVTDGKTGGVGPQSQAAQERIIEARLEAQTKRGITKPRTISQNEAENILGFSDTVDMPPDELMSKLQEASDRAEETYGKRYAKQVMKDAIGFVVKGKDQKMIAGGLVSQMLSGEVPSIEDYRAAKTLSDLDKFGRAFDGGFQPDMGDQSRPSISPARVQQLNQVTGYAGQQAIKQPYPEEIEELRKRPENWKTFDRLYGRGASARALATTPAPEAGRTKPQQR